MRRQRQPRYAPTATDHKIETVADSYKQDRTRSNLPRSARIVRIDGGNHSQFAYYGFQPGDWPATITRDDQQAITRRAILDALATASVR